jgi:sialic acid synthase SpsE
VKIGDRTLGSHTRAYIIAEIGSNFHILTDCLAGIRLATDVGADAVKFQLYSHQELYGCPGPVLPGEMPRDWLPELAAFADRYGIDLLCSAFSLDGLDYVNTFVKAHKVASCEAVWPEFVAKAMSYGKTVLCSTGALDLLGQYDGSEMIPLICDARYPSPGVDLYDACRVMGWNVQGLWGISDHTMDYEGGPWLATQQGAVVVEKHFNPLGFETTPDAGHSLSLDQFRHMVSRIRGAKYSRTLPVDIVEYHRRREVNGQWVRLKMPLK